MLVLQEDIWSDSSGYHLFGMSEVTEYVQAGERPLALYYFDDDHQGKSAP